MTIVERVRGAVKNSLEESLAPEDRAHLVVAVSGGADSVALLDALHALESAAVVFHLDHGARPESPADARFVEALSRRFGLPCCVVRRDVPEAARHGGESFEATARKIRYETLSDLAAGRWAATGHTLDDQAETVLLRLLRGAGPGGLSGIRHHVRLHGVRVVRPLLRISRAEGREYLQARGLEWIEDATNQDRSMARNRIRHELLPMLARDYNPRIAEALARTAEIMAQEDDFVESAATEWLGSIACKAGTTDVLLENLISAPVAVIWRVLRFALNGRLRRGPGDPAASGWVHVDALHSLLEARPGARVTLPGGTLGLRKPGRVVIQDPVEEPLVAPPSPESFEMPGTRELTSWNLRLRADPVDAIGPSSTHEIYLDAKRSGSVLSVRSRRPGDHFQPLGMQGTKKLKRFFIDEKIPVEQRDRLPLLVTSQDEVVWVIGWRADRRFLAQPGSSEIWRLTAEALEG